MAINAQDGLLSTGRLANPGTPGVFGGLAQGMQARNEIELRKQQLEQQKMQFEQQRQQQEAQLALQRQKMSYDMAEADRIKEQQRQAAIRKDNEEKLVLSTKFSQTLLSGDRVGAEAMLPEMEARGMSVVRESEENGIPNYRVYQSAEERAKEDKEYQRRINMAKASDIRPEDVTIQRGGRLVDSQGAERSRQAETDAVLSEQAQAYPEGEERETYLRSARAALRIPGPTPDRIKAAGELASGPMQNLRGRQQGETTIQAAREARAQNTESRQDTAAKYELKDRGRNWAKEAAANIDLLNYREHQKQLSLAQGAMSNDNPYDDHIMGTMIGRAVGGESGPLSDKDVNRVLGDAGDSFWSQIKGKAYSAAIGGLKPEKRQALIDLIKEKRAMMQKDLHGWMNRVEDIAAKEKDENVREGLYNYLELNTDAEDREAVRAEREKRKPKSDAAAPTSSTAPASVDGKQLIKEFEVGKSGKPVLSAYKDADGHSIGYGHFGATPGQKIDEATAEKLFEEDYARFAKVVDEVAPNATPQQRDAMISLAYNIGEQGFRDSSVAKKHAAGDTKGAAEAFDLYNKSEDKVNSTLVLRRKRERELYESGGQSSVYQPRDEHNARLLELLKAGG